MSEGYILPLMHQDPFAVHGNVSEDFQRLILIGEQTKGTHIPAESPVVCGCWSSRRG